ncbi:MAG TPA: hypothetical protein VKH15_12015 [Candidatus Acidoferrum sp.]|nr:hypothetical protein [Candidatus Acidoferrum sp.]
MMLKKISLLLLLALSGAVKISAQSDTPVITGGLQYESTTSGGVTTMQPVIEPVVLIPLGDHWLIETRATFDEFIFREDGTSGPYHAQTFSTVDYLQLDYIVNSHLTVVVGRFLTPFGIYNERLYPVWLRNFQDVPIIFPIGNLTTASSDGAMIRGALISRKDVEVNYTAFFSTLSTVNRFESGRAGGGRVGVFLPQKRLEVGVSYEKLLQDQRQNSVGAHFAWQPYSAPLDLKAEYAHSRNGQGYWAEAGYRFSQFRGEDSWLGRFQAIGRVQQFEKGTASPIDGLPGANTRQVDFGLNYYLPHNVRLNTSYGRQFSPLGNSNIWNFEVTYRFLFPLIPGGHN